MVMRKNSTYQVAAAFLTWEKERGNNRNRHSFLNWTDQLGQVELPDLTRATKAESLLQRTKKVPNTRIHPSYRTGF